MSQFWEKLFEFLEKNLPWLFAGYLAGRNLEKKEKLELEKRAEGAELELEKQKNKEIIEAINRGLDDRSIVRRAIDKGRNLLKKNKINLL